MAWPINSIDFSMKLVWSIISKIFQLPLEGTGVHTSGLLMIRTLAGVDSDLIYDTCFRLIWIIKEAELWNYFF
jgi:hypothetical protein